MGGMRISGAGNWSGEMLLRWRVGAVFAWGVKGEGGEEKACI